MSIDVQERYSDSPYVETVIAGRTTGSSMTIRPSEIHWHMVLVKMEGHVQQLVVGPLTDFGEVNFIEGVELLWIKFKLGTFMPHLPFKNFVNAEIALPTAAGKAFWLHGSAWQFPDYENADTFIDQLVRDEALACDPLVEAALKDEPQDIAGRTLRHRFLRSTGLTQNHIRQYERAQQAAALLEQGVPILDTVYDLGYYDQPHLTRSLKRFVGITPARINTPE